jgi:phage-related protein (TIGR01555 family)
VSGLGDPTRDKRLAATPTTDNRPQDFLSLELLWRSSDMAARIIETPADELIRKFPKVQVGKGGDAEIGELLDDALEDLHAQEAFRTALQYRRAYGGGAILIGANDGADIRGLTRPLDEKRLQSIDYLNVFTPWECRVLHWQNNPLKKGYGEPEVYRITPIGLTGPDGSVGLTESFEVHASRIVRFMGPITSRMQIQNRNFGWGDSILARVSEVVRDFDMVFDSSAALTSDFAQGVFKMRGLADAIAGDAEGLVQKRLLMMEMSRSAVRSVLIDAENEEFDRKTTPMSGLPEVLDRWAYRLAAAARMPVSMLMGKQPSGLNATGETDVRWFYDVLASEQKNELEPAIEYVVELLFKARAGPTKGEEPESWCMWFPPLWQMDDVSRADIYFKTAQADSQYIDHGVLVPEEVANSRFGSEMMRERIGLDPELRANAKMITFQGKAMLAEPDKVDPDAAEPTPPPPKPTAAPAKKPAKKAA